MTTTVKVRPLSEWPSDHYSASRLPALADEIAAHPYVTIKLPPRTKVGERSMKVCAGPFWEMVGLPYLVCPHIVEID